MSKKKLEYTELRSLDSAIEQLQELVDGLRAGVLPLRRGEQQVLLKPGAVLDFAVSAERRGEQERLVLTLEWRRQELSMDRGAPRGARPRSMPVPAGRGLALQAEAERLFDEDESEAPLSSDDDYTVAPEYPEYPEYTVASDTVASDTAAPDTVAPDEVDVPLPQTGSQPAAAPTAAPSAAAPASAAPTVPPSALPGQDELEAIEEEQLDDEAVTVRHSSPPAGQSSLARRSIHSDAEQFERMYAEARVPGADGRPRLDEQRFAESLAVAGLESELQQELCSLARQADAEGRDWLFK